MRSCRSRWQRELNSFALAACLRTSQQSFAPAPWRNSVDSDRTVSPLLPGRWVIADEQVRKSGRAGA
eukprot:2807523-Prymnesium_polylepis.2